MSIKKKVSARKQRKKSFLEKNHQRVPVNTEGLDPWDAWVLSMRFPEGYYEDFPFTCKDCGKEEIWYAARRKRWYEQMRGNPDSIAVRCRACRAKERQRKAEARRISEAGKMKKMERKIINE